MSNDLIELTDTELDAVTGGTGLLTLNFGNIITQVNAATVTGVALNIGGAPGSVAAVSQEVLQQNYIGSFASLF